MRSQALARSEAKLTTGLAVLAGLALSLLVLMTANAQATVPDISLSGTAGTESAYWDEDDDYMQAEIFGFGSTGGLVVNFSQVGAQTISATVNAPPGKMFLIEAPLGWENLDYRIGFSPSGFTLQYPVEPPPTSVQFENLTGSLSPTVQSVFSGPTSNAGYRFSAYGSLSGGETISFTSVTFTTTVPAGYNVNISKPRTYSSVWGSGSGYLGSGDPDPGQWVSLVDAAPPDADEDGVLDDVDNCPTVANADQANNDGDGAGDACDPDDDNDGVLDGGDNCQFDANADQANYDGDAFGDVCDSDDDNDGVVDGDDPFPFSDSNPTVVIGECDAGVANLGLGDGANFNDLIGEATATAANHGAFVSAVADLSNDWKKAKLISGRQHGKIVSCAARSDIP